MGAGTFLFTLTALTFAVLAVVSEICWTIQASKPFFVVFIPNRHYGVVTKKFVLFNRNRRIPEGTCVALRGEVGPQADLLLPGWHFGFWPLQYEVELHEALPSAAALVVITALGGKPLPQGRRLGTFPRGEDDLPGFQRRDATWLLLDARRFLEGGGQRGVQSAVRPLYIEDGIYYNPYLFKVELAPPVKIPAGHVGIVTVLEGAELPAGRTVAPVVYEGGFEDPDAFFAAGGFMGLQEPILLPRHEPKYRGLVRPYNLNPYFARVDIRPEFHVPHGNIGVIVIDRGREGSEIQPGEGAQAIPAPRAKRFAIGGWLLPGHHPINPHYQKVEFVPTDHVALNWAYLFESHRFDKNLHPIAVALAGGWSLLVEVTLIVRVTFEEAGNELIARFGSFEKFAVEVLQCALEGYFRDRLKRYEDVKAFFVSHEEHQRSANDHVANAAAPYGVRVLAARFGDRIDLSQSDSTSAASKEELETSWS